MTNIKKISYFNFKSKKVLVRVDLNVPIKNGIVADATRIKAILPTLNQISRKGGICIIISHFGKPKGKKIGMYSLKKIVHGAIFFWILLWWSSLFQNLDYPTSQFRT